MGNTVYKDIDELITDNRFIHDVKAKLNYHHKGKTTDNDIEGDLIKSWSLLDSVITNNASYQLRGTCKLGHLVHDIEITNRYINDNRYLVLTLKKCFYSNKEMLRELIFDEKLRKSFVNITNALARAYIHLSKLTHSREDITDIRVLIDSLPAWTKDAYFGSVRIKSDPWAVINKALALRDDYYSSLGVP